MQPAADVSSRVSAPTKGEVTRRAILDAAIARFGRDGFRATSVANIARDAGLSGTAAYAYFDDKEALFFAAVDEDAAEVVRSGLSSVSEDRGFPDWQRLIYALIGSLQHHPLARRLLAGLEPEVTERVLEMPALEELRDVVADRLRAEQQDGSVRADVDTTVMARGIVAITLSLLMSVVQLGPRAAETYGAEVAAVLEHAVRRQAPG